MPTYEYACDKCGHEFEREQRITDDPVKTCPECRGRRVRRLISNTSFVLKGSGWYSDLYSSAKPQIAEKAEAGKAAGGDAAEKSAKGEGKSADAAKDTSSKPSKADSKSPTGKKKASG